MGAEDWASLPHGSHVRFVAQAVDHPDDPTTWHLSDQWLLGDDLLVAPVATPDELADYDAIIFGVPTRFGNMPAQMKNFLDQTGGFWFTGKLIGKVGSVFSSSATQHGGQESTILSTHTVLLHQGMVIVGLPYSFQGQMGVSEITGGSPYGPFFANVLIRTAQGPLTIDVTKARFAGVDMKCDFSFSVSDE